MELVSFARVTRKLVGVEHDRIAAPLWDRDRNDFSLEAAEREFIQRALNETGWQRTRAAALLGITRATLYAKLKRYDIKAPDGRAELDVGELKDDKSGASVPPKAPTSV